jgi:hypothetical protein
VGCFALLRVSHVRAMIPKVSSRVKRERNATSASSAKPSSDLGSASRTVKTNPRKSKDSSDSDSEDVSSSESTTSDSSKPSATSSQKGGGQADADVNADESSGSDVSISGLNYEGELTQVWSIHTVLASPKSHIVLRYSILALFQTTSKLHAHPACFSPHAEGGQALPAAGQPSPYLPHD